jgi:protocadherin delta 1
VQSYKLQTDGSDTWRLTVDEEVDGGREVMLALTDHLDRETTGHYHLQVVAYDGGSSPRSGSIDIFIEVEDANDNSPVFDQESYEVVIDENTPRMTNIIQIRARDADWGQNGKVQYSLSSRSANAYGHLFGIHNSTGQVYVKGLVDYEESSSYHLSITARDSGPGSVPSSTSLLINIRDLNDHAPHITVNTLFARDTNRSLVPEDSPIQHFVAHAIVKDPDSGMNGVFNCSLEGRAFRLEQTFPEEYHILTAKELDREQKAEYRLTMKCVDKGSPAMTSTKHILVVVTDVNDNAPVFREHSYVAELFENNYIGVYVANVNATDADEGRNAEVVYGLGPSDLAFFDIDPVKGKITARESLDRERRSEYNVRVVARDKGEPEARTSTVSLLVKVLDVNDEKPLFTSSVYSFGVDENQPAGYQVGILSAHDADDPPYDAHSIFLLPAGSLSDAFEMDEESGMVRTTRPLDREQQSVYELIAVARDINAPTISSTATVSIHVMDLNDNPPKFTFPTPTNNTVQLSHKVPLGHVVTKVQARDLDRDSNGKIMYQLTKGNADGVFTVDPNSGALSVNVDLRDYPDNRTWHLEVTATDYGDLPLSTSTTLFIVLNHSLTTSAGLFASLFSGSNFVILIAVGCISGALIVVLLVVIVVLLRRQQLKRRRMQRYNCRMHALQRMTAEELKAQECKDIKQNEYTIIPKKETDVYDEEKMDLSHEKSRQWLETLEPNRYEVRNDDGCHNAACQFNATLLWQPRLRCLGDGRRHRSLRLENGG